MSGGGLWMVWLYCTLPTPHRTTRNYPAVNSKSSKQAWVWSYLACLPTNHPLTRKPSKGQWGCDRIQLTFSVAFGVSLALHGPLLKVLSVTKAILLFKKCVTTVNFVYWTQQSPAEQRYERNDRNHLPIWGHVPPTEALPPVQPPPHLKLQSSAGMSKWAVSFP